MSSPGEGEQPTAEEAKASQGAKPVKEKKPKAPKQKKPKTAAHPPYFQMIKEALLALKDKGGSSPYAIAKYMEEKHKSVLPANFRKILALQLKNQAARGKLVKIKASYKLAEIAKKEKEKKKETKMVTRSTTEKKEPPKRKAATTTTAAAPKVKSTKKTETTAEPAKRGGAKKTTPTKPNVPKSLRSPSRRARKVTAAA
ncbi:hypothetical protein L6164_027647 [Bauhinia variegata]|uniref:Uncharacterized protein n=1 Tax=Bauhinia variegata TaxID=167791 RepID=A0ACB9LU19_BAUVA|nr:hypothetical protein L6164_027647 [Bauhinia variegata]